MCGYGRIGLQLGFECGLLYIVAQTGFTPYHIFPSVASGVNEYHVFYFNTQPIFCQVLAHSVGVVTFNSPQLSESNWNCKLRFDVVVVSRFSISTKEG